MSFFPQVQDIHFMYCGELQGSIQLCHLGMRARDVRRSVGEMFAPTVAFKNDIDAGWKDARKAGWRVRKVMVAACVEAGEL